MTARGMIHDPPYEILRVPQQGGGTKTKARATCRNCSVQQTITLTKKLPSQVVVQKFVDAGWSVRGNYNALICPSCTGSKITRPNPNVEIEKMAPKSTLRVVAPREPTTKELRQIMAYLEMYFDEKKGRYENKYSDQRIAQELDIPHAMVANVRKEAFGELILPAGVAALKEELDELGKRLSALTAQQLEIGRELNDAHARITEIENAHS